LPAAQLVGSAEGIGSASGALGVALVGSASGTGTASGTLSQSVDLEGTAEGIGQAQATITPVQAVLSGTCLGLGSGFGDLRPALIPGHHSARVIPRRGHITSTSAARRATVGITLAHNAVVKPGRNARITTNDHNVEVVPL
jgi:hypothetical protein